MGTRRTLQVITEQDKPGEGRPTMFGFGPGWLGWIGCCTRRAVLRTIARGIPLYNPLVAVAWGAARRGQPEAARVVLRVFGYDQRYRVSRRSLVAIHPRDVACVGSRVASAEPTAHSRPSARR